MPKTGELISCQRAVGGIHTINHAQVVGGPADGKKLVVIELWMNDQAEPLRLTISRGWAMVLADGLREHVEILGGYSRDEPLDG